MRAEDTMIDMCKRVVCILWTVFGNGGLVLRQSSSSGSIAYVWKTAESFPEYPRERDQRTGISACVSFIHVVVFLFFPPSTRVPLGNSGVPSWSSTSLFTMSTYVTWYAASAKTCRG